MVGQVAGQISGWRADLGVIWLATLLLGRIVGKLAIWRADLQSGSSRGRSNSRRGGWQTA